ncbi:hypothetical protein [Streptomonospora salina]|uniref:Uncharacterized protein n=1 Tax=Streptomonospora salina TaxID=104205 RepID=A0A841EAW2_9ACTN|nr:hypothetical protein [Streptomonospora salina]MBB6000142.1 hypothetical protein [Streptomonospora salina]
MPAAIPGTRGVARWWATVEDRDHYAADHGHPCTEGALPERVRLGGRDSSGHGNTQDSLLHHPRAQGRAATRAGGGESRALVDPGVWVHTLDAPPEIQSTALRPEVAAWLARGIGGGTDQLCKYYLGSEGRYCDATPTRPFQNGRY